MKRKWLVWLTIVLFFPLTATRFNQSFAQEKEITAEELVAAHLKSIGSPEALKGLQSRVVSGSASVRFLQGAAGTWENGQFIIASEPRKVGIRMVFDALNYPGEHFAYDGQNVTVGHINPGERSPLGDFVFRFNGIVKEGLMGGALSVAWPLLNMEGRQAELKYSKGKLEGRPVHKIEYCPKKNLNMTIKLFFDWENYRHVRTEYTVRHKSDMTSMISIVPDYQMSFDMTPVYSSGNPPNMNITWNGWRVDQGSIMTSIPDSIYTLVEKFDNFKPVGDLTLPYSYTIEYSAEGQGLSFVANWLMKAGPQFTNNGQIESDFFRAQR